MQIGKNIRHKLLITALMLVCLIVPATVNAAVWHQEPVNGDDPVIEETISGNSTDGYLHSIKLPPNMKININGLRDSITDRSGFTYNYISDPSEETVDIYTDGVKSPISYIQNKNFDESKNKDATVQDVNGQMYYLLNIDGTEEELDGEYSGQRTYECVPYKTVKYDGKLVIDATSNASLEQVLTLNGTITLSDKIDYESKNFHIKDGKGTFTVQSNQKITLSGLYRDATYNLTVTKPSDTSTYKVNSVNISPDSGTIGTSSTATVKMSVQKNGTPVVTPDPQDDDPSPGEEIATGQTVWVKALPVKKGGKIKVSWSKVKDAQYYVVYGSVKGKSMKKIKKTTSLSYTQKVKKSKTYQYKVYAYHKNTKVGESNKILSMGKRYSKKYSMVRSLTLKTSNGNVGSVLTLSPGQTVKLNAIQSKYKKSKKYFSKGRVSYEWDDASVISISGTKMKAIGKGETVVDAYTVNGLHKRFVVRVR